MATAIHNTYQLKITLSDIRPPIWRRVVVSSATSLETLHLILQITMGWTNSHLHQFIIGKQRYGVPDPDFEDGMNDQACIKLNQLLKKEKDRIIYEYDFGDGWQHTVTLEKILPFEPKAVLPECIKGKRACPPEDVGGPWGYFDFLEAYSNQHHEQH